MISPIGPCPARIMIIGDLPSAEDLRAGLPFVGYSGQEFSKMLLEAKLNLNSCFRTSLMRTKVSDPEALAVKVKNRITAEHSEFHGRWTLPLVLENLHRLRQEIAMCQPSVIIACGNLSLWALTAEWGITNWRGSLLECQLDLGLSYKPKVIPVYSPSMIFRQWSWRPIMVHDLRKAEKQSHTQEITRTRYEFITRSSFDQTLQVLAQLYSQVERRSGEIAVDIETKAGYIECIALAWSSREAICIPFMSRANAEGYWSEEQEVQIVFALQELLTHPNCIVLGQNFSYDDQYIFRHWKFSTNLYRDTMIAQHSLFGNMQKSLSFLSSMYIEDHIHWKDEGKVADDEVRWTYNCKDAAITFEVAQQQKLTIGAMGMQEVEAFQQSLYPAVMYAMRTGIRIDEGLRSRFDEEIQQMVAMRVSWLEEVLGYLPNIKSPLQMQKLFYGELGQQPVISRKTGTVSCDEEALQKLVAKEPLLTQLVQTIGELRSLGVFLSTFVRAKLREGRMHCAYSIAGTGTYRFNSTATAFGEGTNLQNVPSGDESGMLALPNVRKMFVPDAGKLFFDVDLDSADLRIVAWEAELDEMKQMLAAGKKVYVEVMKEYYKDSSLTKHDKRYTIFKSLCHGTHYLGTAKGLAQRLGLGVHETEIIQRWYYGKFPGLRKWQEAVKDSVYKRKMVQNIFGYRCYFFDRIEGTIFNQAIAWIPQSTVACIISRAMKKLHREYPWIQVLLQVHDSLGGQFPTWRQAEAELIIQQAVEIELPYASPCTIPAEVHTSPISWGHCK